MKTVMEMAREADPKANLYEPYCINPETMAWLEAFEALVRAEERNKTWTQKCWTEYERSIAAQEREACAKICDEFCYGSTKILVEKAIRARGAT